MNDRGPMSIGDLGVNGGSHFQFKLACVCVCALMLRCQITQNGITLEIIQIIQFCLKIYDLWRPLLAHDVIYMTDLLKLNW